MTISRKDFYANVKTFESTEYGLVACVLTDAEKDLSWAMFGYLKRACEMARKRGSANFETKLFGRLLYTERVTGRGRKISTEHALTVLNGENVLGYKEMRIALMAAIWGISGQSPFLIVDFSGSKAVWNFLGGSAMSDAIR